jgi:hypothetical protein
MKKTLDLVIKALPDNGKKKGNDKFWVFLGEEYKKDPQRTKACGIFLGSADKKTGEVEFQIGATKSYLVLQNMEEVSRSAVLFLDTTGFYLMERATALDLVGGLDDV